MSKQLIEPLEIHEDHSWLFSDTAILDWVEAHLLAYSQNTQGKAELLYTENGRDKTAVGHNMTLRQLVAGILWEKT